MTEPAVGTRFRLTALHFDLFRAAFVDAVHGGPPPRPRLVACPTCQQSYFADTAAPDARIDELERWEALAKLSEDCPDHAHSFAVGPYGPPPPR